MDPVYFVTSFVAFVLYLNTLDADFAYDDSRAIQKNQDLEPETPLINIFYDDFWGTPLTHTGSHKSYRPLCVLTFRLNYFLGQLDPWGYHLGNIILHAIVTAIFTKLSRIILKNTFPTVVSGLIFASHPVHTEAVAGVVGRADVGACLFFILALLSYMEYVTLREQSSGGSRSLRFVYFGGTAILTTASMLTKEQGVTVLGVCAAFDLFVHAKMTVFQILQFYKQPRHKRAMEGVILLGLVGVGLVAFRVYFMGNKPPEFAPSDNPASDSDSYLTRTLTYLLLPSLNIWILMCPRVLSFDWSMTSIPLVESISDYRNIFTLIFYSSLIYFAYLSLDFIHQHSKHVMPYMNGHGQSNNHGYQSKHSPNKSSKTFQQQTSVNEEHSKNSVYSNIFTSSHLSQHSINVIIFSAAIIVLPFIPATNLFFYVGFVIAERVLYIPSMGFCLLIGHGSYLLYKKYEQQNGKQTVVKACVVILILLNSAKTFRRNYDWRTEENLYSSGIAVNPAKAWGNLANIYNSQGRTTDAETAYRNALKYRPNMSDVHYNLGILLQNQKRTEEALKSYRTAINFRPNLSMAHLNLAILLAQIGEHKEAEKVYRHCADLETSKLKDPRLHDSTKISCLYNLGRLYSDLHKNEEAIATFEEALRRRPSHYSPQSIYNMYGEVYANTGRHEQAEDLFNKALKVKPDHMPAHITMAKLQQKKGMNKAAEEWFLKARKLDPNDASAIQHYAQFLGDIGRLEESSVMYSDIVQSDPDNFEMVFNAANIFRQVQKNEEAEKLFKRATELKPTEATAHMNLGAMYHINGKLKEGEKSYRRALEIKPNDKITMENLKKLRNLMSTST